MRRNATAVLLLLTYFCLAGQKQPTYKVGEVDRKGRMVVYVDRGGAFETPFWLEHRYAVMLVNGGLAKNQRVPIFIFADRMARKVVQTSDIAVFRKALKGLPRNAQIRQYDSCSVSRSYGLSDETWRKYESALKGAHLKSIPEPHIICICDSRG